MYCTVVTTKDEKKVVLSTKSLRHAVAECKYWKWMYRRKKDTTVSVETR